MLRDRKAARFEGVTLSELPDVANALIREAGPHRVWCFHAEMGAGKTTLIKAICEALGVDEVTASPTFSIVNEYRTAADEPVYHFDFYRLKSEAEAYDIGVEDYLYSGKYCFLEWAEKIPSLLPEENVGIQISIENNTQRTIALSVHDGEKENRI